MLPSPQMSAAGAIYLKLVNYVGYLDYIFEDGYLVNCQSKFSNTIIFRFSCNMQTVKFTSSSD